MLVSCEYMGCACMQNLRWSNCRFGLSSIYTNNKILYDHNKISKWSSSHDKLHQVSEYKIVVSFTVHVYGTVHPITSLCGLGQFFDQGRLQKPKWCQTGTKMQNFSTASRIRYYSKTVPQNAKADTHGRIFWVGRRGNLLNNWASGTEVGILDLE